MSRNEWLHLSQKSVMSSEVLETASLCVCLRRREEKRDVKPSTSSDCLLLREDEAGAGLPRGAAAADSWASGCLGRGNRQAPIFNCQPPESVMSTCSISLSTSGVPDVNLRSTSPTCGISLATSGISSVNLRPNCPTALAGRVDG